MCTCLTPFCADLYNPWRDRALAAPRPVLTSRVGLAYPTLCNSDAVGMVLWRLCHPCQASSRRRATRQAWLRPWQTDRTRLRRAPHSQFSYGPHDMAADWGEGAGTSPHPLSKAPVSHFHEHPHPHNSTVSLGCRNATRHFFASAMFDETSHTGTYSVRCHPVCTMVAHQNGLLRRQKVHHRSLDPPAPPLVPKPAVNKVRSLPRQQTSAALASEGRR
eukprot:360468-Chlamydomonas_euryale.AAC.9